MDSIRTTRSRSRKITKVTQNRKYHGTTLLQVVLSPSQCDRMATTTRRPRYYRQSQKLKAQPTPPVLTLSRARLSRWASAACLRPPGRRGRLLRPATAPEAVLMRRPTDRIHLFMYSPVKVTLHQQRWPLVEAGDC